MHRRGSGRTPRSPFPLLLPFSPCPRRRSRLKEVQELLHPGVLERSADLSLQERHELPLQLLPPVPPPPLHHQLLLLRLTLPLLLLLRRLRLERLGREEGERSRVETLRCRGRQQAEPPTAPDGSADAARRARTPAAPAPSRQLAASPGVEASGAVARRSPRPPPPPWLSSSVAVARRPAPPC